MRRRALILALGLTGCAAKHIVVAHEPTGDAYDERRTSTRTVTLTVAEDTDDKLALRVEVVDHVPVDTMHRYEDVSRQSYVHGGQASLPWFALAGLGVTTALVSAARTDENQVLVVDEHWGDTNGADATVSQTSSRSPNPSGIGIGAGLVLGVGFAIGGGAQVGSGLLPPKEVGRTPGTEVVSTREVAEPVEAAVQLIDDDGAPWGNGTTDTSGDAALLVLPVAGKVPGVVLAQVGDVRSEPLDISQTRLYCSTTASSVADALSRADAAGARGTVAKLAPTQCLAAWDEYLGWALPRARSGVGAGDLDALVSKDSPRRADVDAALKDAAAKGHADHEAVQTALTADNGCMSKHQEPTAKALAHTVGCQERGLRTCGSLDAFPSEWCGANWRAAIGVAGPANAQSGVVDLCGSITADLGGASADACVRRVTSWCQ